MTDAELIHKGVLKVIGFVGFVPHTDSISVIVTDASTARVIVRTVTMPLDDYITKGAI